ncbi:MAG: phosphate acetyltransferase [Candidatus Omnitrophota bacterium]
MDIFQKLKEKAKSNPKKIILPESLDERILYAVDIVLKEKIADITLLGEEEVILRKSKELGLANLKKAEIINYTEEKHFEKSALYYYNLRQYKGITLEEARQKVKQPVYFAALMVRENLADGFVAGASFTSRHVAKAAIEGVGIDKNIQTVSSSFLMVVPDCDYGENGIFMFADCGIIPSPSVKQLANIAISTANLFKQIMEVEPKVAMLSYSSYGSGTGDSVERMRAAAELVKNTVPGLMMDGELQADAALVPKVASIKVPRSSIAGKANVLIFPSLAAGNICYKLVQRLANARAIGPILQGLLKPCSDLSRGCNVQDVVDAIILNVVRAQ